MFLIVVAVSLLSGVIGQQTEGGANVIFARSSSSNTTGESYENAHLVFVTEFNRGIRSSTPVSEFRNELGGCGFDPGFSRQISGCENRRHANHMVMCRVKEP
ncbi:hypothetical protein TNCV_4482981 [Trichonephila clavipes]|nr:hypothetical protein TNCV_4482981 [Trichonephila clavipes]